MITLGVYSLTHSLNSTRFRAAPQINLFHTCPIYASQTYSPCDSEPPEAAEQILRLTNRIDSIFDSIKPITNVSNDVISCARYIPDPPAV